MESDYGSNWNIRDLLADLMEARAELKPAPRAEIWASDLGKPYIDRWLQMKGVPYSNPPTGKGLVTFFLGKQIELGFERMLTECGVAFRCQEKVAIQEEGWLPVVGKPDLIVEVGDWQNVVAAMDERLADYPADQPGTEAQVQALKGLLVLWRKRCPEGLLPTVFEVKSLNSMAFKYHRSAEGLSNAYPHHRLQLYTYMVGLGIAEGHLVYVARDTGWIEEVIVRASDELEQLWRGDIETMTHYYQSDRRPPLEPLKLDGKDNWRVSYSRYKDYLYKEGDDGAFSF
jgi:hypothetical protein